MESDMENYQLSYETLWKTIIRPPRIKYNSDDLIDNIFSFHSRTYYRKDYDLINKKGLTLKCSLIEPDDDNRPFETMPLVIYLHGNSSSRKEGLNMMTILLKNNINLFVFDFSGSGISEGKYISLGYHEKEDLNVVMDFVCKLPGVGKIGLWGRSMGAATALMYAYSDKRISCCIYDSAFSEFRLLAKQLCSNYKKIPNWLVDFAFLFIKKTILNINGVDIDQLTPIDFAKKTEVPGFFIHATNDELIPLEHSLKLYKEYKGEKVINVCEGKHNTRRSADVLKKVILFFKKYLLGECKGDNNNKDEEEDVNEKEENDDINNKKDNDNDNKEEEEKEVTIWTCDDID